MYLLLGAIPIIRCSRGTAAEMVAVVRTVFVNTYHCFKTFHTSLLLFSVLDRDLMSLYPFPCEGDKTGKEIHPFSFLGFQFHGTFVETVMLGNQIMRNLNNYS